MKDIFSWKAGNFCLILFDIFKSLIIINFIKVIIPDSFLPFSSFSFGTLYLNHGLISSFESLLNYHQNPNSIYRQKLNHEFFLYLSYIAFFFFCFNSRADISWKLSLFLEKDSLNLHIESHFSQAFLPVLSLLHLKNINFLYLSEEESLILIKSPLNFFFSTIYVIRQISILTVSYHLFLQGLEENHQTIC